jgi:hypothetical protein
MWQDDSFSRRQRGKSTHSTIPFVKAVCHPNLVLYHEPCKTFELRGEGGKISKLTNPHARESIRRITCFKPKSKSIPRRGLASEQWSLECRRQDVVVKWSEPWKKIQKPPNFVRYIILCRPKYKVFPYEVLDVGWVRHCQPLGFSFRISWNFKMP